jgi:cell division transport system ATP-binding protein
VVLTGHSGAGKSTLLKMIPVIERPSTGRVIINDQDLGQLRRKMIPYYRRTLGLVLQNDTLLHDRSAADNVLLPLAVAGHAPREAARRVEAALDRVGLSGRGKEMPKALSGGEQQRLAIARAIVNRPSILIADEPTAFLDPAYGRDIVDLFRSFNAAGVTVMISSHEESLFDFAPRTLHLSHGKLS